MFQGFIRSHRDHEVKACGKTYVYGKTTDQWVKRGTGEQQNDGTYLPANMIMNYFILFYILYIILYFYYKRPISQQDNDRTCYFFIFPIN